MNLKHGMNIYYSSVILLNSLGITSHAPFPYGRAEGVHRSHSKMPLFGNSPLGTGGSPELHEKRVRRPLGTKCELCWYVSGCPTRLAMVYNQVRPSTKLVPMILTFYPIRLLHRRCLILKDTSKEVSY